MLTAAAIEKGRWALLPAHPEQDRIVQTPTYVLGGAPPRGAHVFLLTDTLYIAVVEPPFGTETRPLVLTVPISEISRLIADDTGLLAIENRSSTGEQVSNILDLYPSEFSARLMNEVRRLWVAQTGAEPEGRRGWELWKAAPFPTGEWAAVLRDASTE